MAVNDPIVSFTATSILLWGFYLKKYFRLFLKSYKLFKFIKDIEPRT